MSATIITGNEPAKVARADSILSTWEDQNKIDKYYLTEKQTTVVWSFRENVDADLAARLFMNDIGFEYVQRP